MKIIFILLILGITISGNTQSKGDNTIKIKGVDFLQVCSALLDAGYVIEKKDNDLQAAKTEFKTGTGKNKWMKLLLNIRMNDSTAIVTGQWYNTLVLGHKLFGQDQSVESLISRIENTNGNPKACFKEMNNFALSFRKEITYSKE